MKKSLLLVPIVALTLSSCSSWVRIGDLTAVSNRNIDDSKKYTLISRDVEAIAKADSDAMEQAVDNLTRKYQGEFVRNVKIYVKDDGKQVKVIGDVWGLQSVATNITTTANANIELKVGDAVAFRDGSKIIDGTIIGINANKLIVEYGRRKKRIELRFDQVTKTLQPNK